ncbi:hypothetical protein GF378_02295 [Candidatus Pacearchaeota archaeon]|nr:hypothetical protein [Candidatus Pacearchaeota archaeon]
MKRVAFCDREMPQIQFGNPEEYSNDVKRLEHNIEIMERLGEKYDILQYSRFNVHRIRKNYPIDAIITHLNKLSAVREDTSGAELSDLKLMHKEFPEMRIILYTDWDYHLEESLRQYGSPYNKYKIYGVNKLILRKNYPESRQEELEDILDILESVLK